MQACSEPVTGSSGMPAHGAKNRDHASCSALPAYHGNQRWTAMWTTRLWSRASVDMLKV